MNRRDAAYEVVKVGVYKSCILEHLFERFLIRMDSDGLN